jgi:phosphopantetheinyl transferase
MIHSEIYQLNFEREKGHHIAYLSICSKSDDVLQNTFLGSREIAYYDSYHGNRRVEYLITRLLTKDLVQKFYINKGCTDIQVIKGVFGQPILLSGLHDKILNVSISHKKSLLGALVFESDHPIGLDIELLMDNPNSILKSMCKDEIYELEQQGLSTINAWSAKEAISKILCCGNTVDFNLFKVTNLRKDGDRYFGEYQHFPQYKFIGFIVKDHIITIAYPKKSKITIKKI